MSTTKEPKPIQDQITEFERENPKIAEAMKLFGITMTEYQAALYAMQGPQIIQSTSTTALEAPKRG